jgi:hypothetical protein
VVIVNKVHVLESHIFVNLFSFFDLGDDLAIVGGSLDIITLVNVDVLVEDVSNHDEVDGPATALVFHFVEAIYRHQVSLWIFFNEMSVVFNDVPQFEVFFSTDRLDQDARISGIVDETARLPWVSCLIPSDV